MTDKQYDSDGHIVKWLAPGGNLHDSAGFLDKNEHIIVTVGLSVADELEKLIDLGDKAKPADVTKAIIKTYKNLNHTFINLSGSRSGNRSKQLIQKFKPGGSSDDEDKPGWVSRNVTKRNPEDPNKDPK